MSIELSDVISWVIVGIIVGPLVGRVATGKKGGWGWWKNSGVGLIGAAIGGVIWNLFGFDLGLGDIRVTLEDLVAACVGVALLWLIVVIWKKSKGKPGTA